MKAIRTLLRITEYISIAGIVIMALLFFTGNMGYGKLKLFLTIFELLVAIFIFLNCTDDYKTPFEKLYRFIGWVVLLVGIFLVFVIYESVKPDSYWPWLNSILVLGLFAAQLSEINEMKRVNDLLRLINFVVALLAFVFILSAIFGHPFSFAGMFILIGLNLVTVLSLVLTGRMK